jgi:thiaminase/transcriptional activator TenA
LYGAEKAYFDAWQAVRQTAEQNSRYWPFVDNWSSQDFGEWVVSLEALLDASVVSGPTASMSRAFDRVVRFELRFWDAVYAGEQW